MPTLDTLIKDVTQALQMMQSDPNVPCYISSNTGRLQIALDNSAASYIAPDDEVDLVVMAAPQARKHLSSRNAGYQVFVLHGRANVTTYQEVSETVLVAQAASKDGMPVYVQAKSTNALKAGGAAYFQPGEIFGIEAVEARTVILHCYEASPTLCTTAYMLTAVAEASENSDPAFLDPAHIIANVLALLNTGVEIPAEISAKPEFAGAPETPPEPVHTLNPETPLPDPVGSTETAL